MRYLEKLDDSAGTGAGAPQSTSVTAPNMSSASLDPSSAPPSSADHESFTHISHPSSPSRSSTRNTLPSTASLTEKKARLLYCKSHVAVHPTQFNRDNISGYLGIVEVEREGGVGVVQSDAEGGVQSVEGGKELLVTWVPDEVLERMDEEDRESYRRVEGRTNAGHGEDKEEDGFVFVAIPPPKGEKYAFSVPVSSIYSILVYPPSLTHWYGSATFNLMGGISLPTLFFHDDESPLLASSPTLAASAPPPRPQWGFPPFLSLLQSRSVLLRSHLLTARQNHGAELWLVNPSKSDREVHEADVDEPPRPALPVPQQQAQRRSPGHEPRERSIGSPKAAPYPPNPQLPNFSVLGQTTPKQTLMTGLSSITNLGRKAAGQLLSHPAAQPFAAHLPPAVKSLINVPGEWESPKSKSKSKGGEVASEFESARLYLARWARVVAEEGERARRDEVAGQAGLSASSERIGAEDLASSLGVFSLLASPNSKRPIPRPTRTPQHPITEKDWDALVAQGRDELYVRREIFRRGFAGPVEGNVDGGVDGRARKEGWEVLLGVVGWDVGGVGGGILGKEKRNREREEARQKRREEYSEIRKRWKEGEKGDRWREEWHRIDVDCRRTDRNQSIYAVPTSVKADGNEEKEAGGPAKATTMHDSQIREEEENGLGELNPNIAALRSILMTYHTYKPELGYVQGMSDLLSPIYVVFEADEAMAFWALVGVMRMMESNFLRDQSGMKRQLSTLQQLIGIMDPELYTHLDRTGSLNLFFCFRWILIAFKREFKFLDVIRLWDVLWTNYYSDHFVLFVALAILQSHRDVLLRYLTEFDEVLKYANDLSGTIDLDTTLAQAEVLFLSFKGMVDDADRRAAPSEAELERRETGQELRRRKGSDADKATSKGDEAQRQDRRGKEPKISEDLRSLLVSWRPSAGPV